MIVATVTALILIFGVDNLGLAESVSSIYPLPENYREIGEKALAGTVFPVKLIIAIVITTISWILATYLTKPESKETLRSFYRLTRPGGPGWKRVILEARAEGDFIDEQDAGKKWEMPIQILCVFIGIIVIYTSLFSIGSFIYGEMLRGIILLLVAIAGTVFLFKSFGKLRAD